MSIDSVMHSVVYGDSAYPSGRYTLSNGLEGLVQTGRVAGAEQAGQALLDHLRHASAPADGVATAVAVELSCQFDAQRAPEQHTPNRRASGDSVVALLCAADEELSATKVTDAVRRASTRVGRQTLSVYAQVHSRLSEQQNTQGLLELYMDHVTSRRTAGNQAVALGLIHQRHGLDAAHAVAVEMMGVAMGWASAALRLRQCDHIGAQVMVERARPLMKELAEECVEKALWMVECQDMRHIGSSSPALDLASAAHQYAPARLFMN
ncbi:MULTISPECIES: urease accessory protein UreF [Corynebacterium]|uniref:urease accessory protein UreF n=1 Tax=Corynebacterium TaxID=1716 RepID=UPI001E44CB1A|nr:MULTISPECIES: urease accessory UreF family protein [Corynebacterium]